MLDLRKYLTARVYNLTFMKLYIYSDRRIHSPKNYYMYFYKILKVLKKIYH